METLSKEVPPAPNPAITQHPDPACSTKGTSHYTITNSVRFAGINYTDSLNLYSPVKSFRL